MGSLEYFEDEEFREMLNEYEQTVNSGQMVFMDAEDLADIADYYHLHGRYEESEQAIGRALELEPDSPIAWSFKIHEALSRKDYETAEDYLDQIIEREHPEYIYCRAEIWITQGMIDKADEYLRDCQKYVSPLEHQDYVYDVVSLWTDYNCSEKAMEWMMRVAPDDMGDPDEFKELMGRAYFGIGDYDESERIFNELLDKNPFEKRYWHALANAQYMKEDYGASVTSSEYAIAIDPEDPEGIMAKANALFRLESFEEALKYYERYAEKKKENDEAALLYQGCCLINLKRRDEALERLLAAEKAAPADSPYLAEIYQELGFVYSELHMPEMALQCIDKTKNLNCDQADMLVFRGHILLACGNLDEAQKAYRQALKTSNFSPQTLMRIIVSVYDNHFLESAYRMFQKYFSIIDETCDEGYSYMALCCHDLLYTDEYLHYLKEACRRNPQEARQVLGHLFPEGAKTEEYYEYAKKKLKT